MASPFSSTQICNTALEQIASQSRVTSLDPTVDSSTVAAAAAVVYEPTVWLLLRELDPDFARFTATLALSAAATPVPPWTFEYLYPVDAVRIRQVRPPATGIGALADPNNPQVVRAQVAFDNITTVGTKVILTNQINALAVYTSASVSEALFDAVFADAVARRLANPLAMALSGRPDFAEKILQQAAQVAQTCEVVDESSVRRF
jgi:hypothetical protein